MSTVFVLIVLTNSYVRWNFQEFTSQERCEYAKSIVLKDGYTRNAECVPK